MAARSQESAPHRQLQVLLTLHDGEQSFGMSLAEKSPVLGPKYTVVSSVFANSPADRAGVRQGYVLRCINDKPVGGLTVAQVANYFRNVGQTKVTLEIEGKPQSSASERDTGLEIEQLVKTPSVVPSGRAVAAPGSALAVPRVAPPKQIVSGPRAKPAAKTIALQPHVKKTYSKASASGLRLPRANDGNSTDSMGKRVDKILYLGRQAVSVQSDKAEENASISKGDITLTSECVSSELSPFSKTVLQSPDQTIATCKGGASTQVAQGIQPKSVPTPAGPSQAIESVSSPSKAPSVPPAKASSIVKVSFSAAAKKSSPLPPSLLAQTKATALILSPQKAKLQTQELSSPSAKLSSLSTVATSGALVSSESTANSRMSEGASTSPILVLNPLNTMNNEVAVASVHRPEPATVTMKISPISPVSIAPMPPATTTKSAFLNSKNISSAPAAAQSSITSKCGKKRRRQRKNSATSNGHLNSKEAMTKKNFQLPDETDVMDVVIDTDDALKPYVFSSDSEEDHSLSTSGTRKGRRCDRPRHSLTIDRLVGMGFTLEDAETSVKKFGDDPDACMVWIISNIEERQFNEDLNRASIQSEESKRDEEKRVKTLERQKLACTTKFMAAFPTSYMVCPESSALKLKTFLQSTINRVQGGAYLRDILYKLLVLEGKSIRWYKEAAKSYMLKLAKRLDIELTSHDVMVCCVQSDADYRDKSCAFVRKIVEEVEALTKALYEMSTNQGGVPPVFLECDETTKFDLEDDGFAVIDPSEL